MDGCTDDRGDGLSKRINRVKSALADVKTQLRREKYFLARYSAENVACDKVIVGSTTAETDYRPRGPASLAATRQIRPKFWADDRIHNVSPPGVAPSPPPRVQVNREHLEDIERKCLSGLHNLDCYVRSVRQLKNNFIGLRRHPSRPPPSFGNLECRF
ncbi:uncharacterized protein LOC132702587 [Cylas formicarius]|uniref:uncharacterized protein LOC132702587 n=1 Tax=Cylas formicarius TaxID=197179 RepID=UPI002958720D|nr:uncharacterized protein LOC132702587 [Cylas formicarius]